MKSKMRNIVVNDIPFVYRFCSSISPELYISLKDNRHCKVVLNFHAEEPRQEIQHFWRFYSIWAVKDTVAQEVPIAMPRFVAQVIQYLLQTTDCFDVKKKSVFYCAWELLSEMGYSSMKPVWIQEF